MNTGNAHKFDSSALRECYKEMPSKLRYNELCRTFPYTMLIFEHGGYYYGFDESAVALRILYGFDYYEKGGMLVVKIADYIFESQILSESNMKGFGYVLDRDGSLTFRRGKKFRLAKDLSYYRQLGRKLTSKAKQKPVRQIKQRRPRGDTNTRHGYGWHDDAWTPGLPSSRLFRKRMKR